MKTPITRRKSWNNSTCDEVTPASGANELFSLPEIHKRSFSVCAGASNAHQPNQDFSPTIEVTPSDLHASSTFIEHNEITEPCNKLVMQTEDVNGTSFIEMNGSGVSEKGGVGDQNGSPEKDGVKEETLEDFESSVEAVSAKTYRNGTNETDLPNSDHASLRDTTSASSQVSLFFACYFTIYSFF